MPGLSLESPLPAPSRRQALRAFLQHQLRVRNQGNRILASMLIALHAAAVWGHGQAWGQAMILVHYGLFLLWQPFFSSQQNLPWPRALGVMAVGATLAILDNIWATSLWIVLLAGLLGGMAMGVKSARERIGLWLAVAYLLLLLFTWMLPHGFRLPVLDAGQPILLRDGLLLAPLTLALFPPPNLTRSSGALDLLYTLLFVLLIGVLALGSYAAMQLTHSQYGFATFISLSTLSLSLLIIAWLWQPRGATSGLRHLFSRYVLSLGLPLEDWLKQLSDAAEREPDPDLFLRAAIAGFTHLPWSTGVTWRTEYAKGELGQESRHAVSFSHQGVEVSFYTDAPVNPAFALHLRLLTEIIGYFHAAKTRERAMQANAYTQAIYETGSRLTHDVKNLLQSLRTLCSAAEHSQPEQAASLQSLMKRQLPQIAKRLEITLDKLKSPEKAREYREVQAREWWRNLKVRYGQDGLSFDIDDADALVWLPQELFDSVADNLIQNALRKRVGQPGLKIRVEMRTVPLPSLIVCDTGTAANAEVTEKLFHAPVSTYDGLGIGLYQAAKQARELGYGLELSRNLDGEVCFTLWQEILAA